MVDLITCTEEDAKSPRRQGVDRGVLARLLARKGGISSITSRSPVAIVNKAISPLRRPHELLASLLNMHLFAPLWCLIARVTWCIHYSYKPNPNAKMGVFF